MTSDISLKLWKIPYNWVVRYLKWWTLVLYVYIPISRVQTLDLGLLFWQC